MPAAPSTTPWRTRASAGATRKVVPTSRLLRSRSGRERLAAPGDQVAASRPRMEVDASNSRGRSDPFRAPPRGVGAPRPLREDARRAPLVGLVCALLKRASEWQQSGGGSRSRRPLHGRGPSCSSPVTPFECPHSRSSIEGALGYAGSNLYRSGFNSSILQQEVHR